MRRIIEETERVRITEVLYEPDVPRDSYIRPTDQVVVFLDDCEFDRIDADTGEHLRRTRKSGETLCHAKGERAPVLVNRGASPFRTLLIELK